MSDDIVEALKASQLFGGMADKRLEQLVKAGKEMRFASGEELVAKGDDAGRFFLILEGSAQVVLGATRSRTLSRGDGVGEIALLDGGKRTATVVATSDLRTFSLASWNFKPFLAEPDVVNAVVALLCRRLREAEAAAG